MHKEKCMQLKRSSTSYNIILIHRSSAPRDPREAIKEYTSYCRALQDTTEHKKTRAGDF